MNDGQNTSYPQESTVITNEVSSPPSPATPPINNSNPTDTDNKKKLNISKKVVATLFGIMFLVMAVGAGLILVNQQQHLNQNAQVACGNQGQACCTVTPSQPSACLSNLSCNGGICTGTSTGGAGCSQNGNTITCPVGPTYTLRRCHSTTNTGINYPDCATNDNCTTESWNGGTITVSSPSCGSNQIDVVEYGGGVCAGSGSACSTGNVCGGSCTSNADCKNPSAAGASVACINGTCQNTTCPGKTVPGANCDCSTLNACGQPCSAAAGLCQTGSSCRYIVGPSCTDNANPNQPTNTYCIPDALPTGWALARCVSRDQGNSYAQINGQNPTLAEIQQACNPSTPTSSPSPTATPGITAACTNIKAYDTSWNPLSPTDLAALQPGDKVRFTVTGTTTGTFDMARFTINGNLQPDTTLKKPLDLGFVANTYYYEYAIPASVTTFTVKAEIHSVDLNQWF